MIFTFKNIRLYDYLSASAAILFVILLISGPQRCTAGAAYGLKLSAEILAPAIFPFAVPVIFLMNTALFKKSKRKILIVYILSLLGGYPIGAKLINELQNNGDISAENAEHILPFCVNSGPSFVILAVGNGIFDNRNIGYILLFSHVITSFFLMLAFYRKLLFSKVADVKSNNSTPIMDNFIYSVHNASNATLSICAFVVLFSVVGAYTESFATTAKPFSIIISLLEITMAISKTRNVYFVSFLLGFAGFSVWMQVFAQSKTNIIRFTVIRTAHGALSAFITALIIKIFGIALPSLGNAVTANVKTVNSGYLLAFSMLVMSALLLVSISSKNHSGNLLRDML